MTVTAYQERIYALLSQVPAGSVTTYAALARAAQSSPRAVGGALRRNPFAPQIVRLIFPYPYAEILLTELEQPCHRCIANSGYVGGFLGDWEDAPSGVNQSKKVALLRSEGVEFDQRGFLVDKERRWDAFKVGK